MADLNGEIIQSLLHMRLEAGPEVQLPHKQSLHDLLNLQAVREDVGQVQEISCHMLKRCAGGMQTPCAAQRLA